MSLIEEVRFACDPPLEGAGFEPSVPLDEVAAPQLPEWSNGQLLKAFFRTADREFESRSSSRAARRQRVGQAIRSWSSILHGRRLKPAPAVAGEDSSRVSPPIRPCAGPRPS